MAALNSAAQSLPGQFKNLRRNYKGISEQRLLGGFYVSFCVNIFSLWKAHNLLDRKYRSLTSFLKRCPEK
jgi:hypothetical protein